MLRGQAPGLPYGDRRFLTAPAVTIRRAGPGDAPAIHELTHAAYAKWVPVIGGAPKPMTTDFNIAVSEHVIDLLLEAGTLAALIELVPATDHVLIENVAVAPAFQGRGHGKTLLAHAETFAASQGCRLMRLYTNSRFTENLRLYERLGYSEDFRETNHRGVIVHMRKALGDA